MTSETKLFIDFEDVIGVQFECMNCHAKTIIPTSKVERLPSKCSNCHHDWFGTPEDARKNKLFQFIDLLAETRSMVAEFLGSDQTKLRVSMEIISPTSKLL
jgi:hypothetical protein